MNCKMPYSIKFSLATITLMLCGYTINASATENAEHLASYSKHGIDVSHHQGEVDWENVKAAKITFAFAKATEGHTGTDPKFAKNWEAMKKIGLTRGAYHFFHPKTDAKSQAEHFIKTVTLEPGDLPPVLDIEIAEKVTSESIDDDIKIWLDLVGKAYGVKPIIYSGKTFITTNLASGFNDHPLWLARYSKFIPKAPGDWKSWEFWQHSEDGDINGVNGAVDMSVFSGNEDDFNKLLIPAM